jgi:hypothetical protein
MRVVVRSSVVACLAALLAAPANAQTARTHADWLALARSGFAIPVGTQPIDLLVEMAPLLASPDPVLRDDVAFGAAEKWVVRDGRLAPADLRRLLDLWTGHLQDGLDTPGDDRIFKRSFSALCLSLIAARDLSTPTLEASEVSRFFDRMLDYFTRERDLRGFDTTRGWMHAVAHTSDALKFLARNPQLPAGSDARLLDAVRGKIEATDAVFVWGENDRIALALHAAVRRPDASPAALEAWVTGWQGAYKALWAKGPHVDSTQFARVENARQVMRSLYTALSMDVTPTSNGDTARKTLLAALARMR